MVALTEFKAIVISVSPNSFSVWEPLLSKKELFLSRKLTVANTGSMCASSMLLFLHAHNFICSYQCRENMLGDYPIGGDIELTCERIVYVHPVPRVVKKEIVSISSKRNPGRIISYSRKNR